MNKETVLYPYDFVIVYSDGELAAFEDGEIIIYSTRDEAKGDADPYGAKVVSCTSLPKKSRKKLRRNIEQFSEEVPF